MPFLITETSEFSKPSKVFQEWLVGSSMKIKYVN